MLGRVRKSSSNSLEELESERLPSKIIKDDSLSIYERTLMKLRQGSQSAQCSPIEESTDIDTSSISTHGEVIMQEVDCSSPSTTTTLNSNESQSLGSSNEHRNKNFSVPYMFSRYKSSQHAISSSDEGLMVIDKTSSCSTVH